MALPRSRARRFCHAVHDEADGRVGRWVSIEAVGKRLGLEPGPAIVLADDCDLAGWVRHDRSHMATSERGRALPHSVTLSDKGWELIRTKARPRPSARGSNLQATPRPRRRAGKL
jgi:hypothetical protein